MRSWGETDLAAVLAEAAEAPALGNVLVQARSLGADLPDLAAMRALLRDTQELLRYEPDPDATACWDRLISPVVSATPPHREGSATRPGVRG